VRRAHRPLALILVLACGCAAPAVDGRAARSVAPTAGSTRPPVDRAVSATEEVRDLVARINRHRRSLGCGALRWDDRLTAVALRHSRDMARRGFFSHTNPDGRDPFDRMRRAGIRFQAAAENLASGQRTGAETFEGWMESRGHRRNLEECAFTRIGIGLHRGRWTCVLARLMSDGPPRVTGKR
jgi:uncharacterized protein YkwD